MNFGVTILESSGSGVVSLDLQKLALRIPNLDCEDELIQVYIDAAQTAVEDYTGRFLTPKQVMTTHDCWPDMVPFPPCEVESITYDTEDETGLEFEDYTIDGAWTPHRIVYDDPDNLPTATKVYVTMTAGYDDCPKELQIAVMQLAQGWYLFRESASPLNSAPKEIPWGLQSILNRWRVYLP